MTFGAEISQYLWSDIFPAVATLAIAWITKEIIPVIHHLADKVHLDVSSKQDAQVQYIVEKWVRYAQGVVEAKYKDQTTTGVDKGAEKFELAVAGILEELPGVNEAEAKVLVEFVLNQIGLGAGAGEHFLEQKLAQWTPAQPSQTPTPSTSQS